MADHDRRSREQDHEHRYLDDFDSALDEMWPPRPEISPGKRTLTQGLYAVQRSAAPAASPEDPDEVRRTAAAGVTGGGETLPYLEAIQRSFGHHDVTGVRAHVGGAAADAAGAIGARAYASGDDVAFARTPDLHLAAHEAAHVVQQRGGIRLSGGVGQAGDAYERHADAVADAVLRGESAEGLLNQHADQGSRASGAVQMDGQGTAEAPRPLTRRWEIQVPEEYDNLRAAMEAELAQLVMSRTQVPSSDGEQAPIRREVELIANSNLAALHRQLEHGQTTVLTMRLIPGRYRYERVIFSAPPREQPEVEFHIGGQTPAGREREDQEASARRAAIARATRAAEQLAIGHRWILRERLPLDESKPSRAAELRSWADGYHVTVMRLLQGDDPASVVVLPRSFFRVNERYYLAGCRKAVEVWHRYDAGVWRRLTDRSDGAHQIADRRLTMVSADISEHIWTRSQVTGI